MFLPNEVENYQNIKASDDLKEQIIKNVDKTHKRNRKIATRLAAATACLVFLALGVNMYMMRNHVLSIDGVPVLYNSRTIDNTTPYSVANIEEENLQICVPLEIRVYKEADITVSDGTITTKKQDEASSTLRIRKSQDLLWYIYTEDVENAKCTILMNGKKYVYELFYEEKNNIYSIRQLEND